MHTTQSDLRIAEAKFWARLVVTPAGCWVWPGAETGKGHGRVRWRREVVTAHRLAAYFVGMVESPKLLGGVGGSNLVLHTCDNPRCCNPEHLYVGTQSDNLKDAYDRDRRRRVAVGRGEHPSCKLRPSDVVEIRAALQRGTTQAALAQKYGVSQTVISRVKRKQSY